MLGTCALALSRGPTRREEPRWKRRRAPGKRRETEKARGSRMRTQHCLRALEERRRVRLRGVKRESLETGFWKPREITLNPQRWKKTWNHLTNYPHLFRLERDESCLWAGTAIVGPQTKVPEWGCMFFPPWATATSNPSFQGETLLPASAWQNFGA